MHSIWLLPWKSSICWENNTPNYLSIIRDKPQMLCYGVEPDNGGSRVLKKTQAGNFYDWGQPFSTSAVLNINLTHFRAAFLCDHSRGNLWNATLSPETVLPGSEQRCRLGRPSETFYPTSLNRWLFFLIPKLVLICGTLQKERLWQIWSSLLHSFDLRQQKRHDSLHWRLDLSFWRPLSSWGEGVTVSHSQTNNSLTNPTIRVPGEHVQAQLQ